MSEADILKAQKELEEAEEEQARILRQQLHEKQIEADALIAVCLQEELNKQGQPEVQEEDPEKEYSESKSGYADFPSSPINRNATLCIAHQEKCGHTFEFKFDQSPKTFWDLGFIKTLKKAEISEQSYRELEDAFVMWYYFLANIDEDNEEQRNLCWRIFLRKVPNNELVVSYKKKTVDEGKSYKVAPERRRVLPPTNSQEYIQYLYLQTMFEKLNDSVYRFDKVVDKESYQKLKARFYSMYGLGVPPPNVPPSKK